MPIPVLRHTSPQWALNEPPGYSWLGEAIKQMMVDETGRSTVAVPLSPIRAGPRRLG
jgi:hypothetical protein